LSGYGPRITQMFRQLAQQLARVFSGENVSDIPVEQPTTFELAINLQARRRRTHAELNDTIESTVADPADNAEVLLEKKHQGEVLRNALTKLSPEHREIIDLVYYHEKSVDEAAEILGIPAATVKTRMFYARKKLAVQVQAAA
jgi:RNA polymerase sigma factor (sigma-70 family)